MDSVI